MDINRDARLSKEEMLSAAGSLRRLEAEDDELVTVMDLLSRIHFGGPLALGKSVEVKGHSVP
jgi:hypothetical protein